ncbi:MAG: hypothetical protein ACRD1L_04050 [Terriglobales bacterium]
MPMQGGVADELAVLKTVASRLNAAGIAYMLTGSLAAAFYAQPRMTRDIDLVVELDPAQTATIAELFREDFLVEELAIRQAVARRGMFNLIHGEALVKVDVIVRKDQDYRKGEFRRRRAIALDEQEIWMVAPEDLILSKLVWARESRSELQLRDVRLLLESVPGLERDYLKRWSARLGVAELLQEAEGG